MRQLTVGNGEKDQRLSKYLQRKLPGAPSSFLYKMLRKKNITLNGKKASGSELLLEGDQVTFFLSDETIRGFGGILPGEEAAGDEENKAAEEYIRAYRQLRGRIGPDGILYEDANVLAVCKPVGILSQKAEDKDRSMNEWLLGYLLEKGAISREQMREFKPSVCNRLDRNTGGILLCAKTLIGARELGKLLRGRTLRKFYQAAVAGTVRKGGDIEGYLRKNEVTNSVKFSGKPSGREETDGARANWTKTVYRPLIAGPKYSLLEMELITGKTHQIRSHLSSIGHPIVGDPKYGDPAVNERVRGEYGLRGQMLWCCRVEFPKMSGELANLSGKIIICDPPAMYREITGRK